MRETDVHQSPVGNNPSEYGQRRMSRRRSEDRLQLLLEATRDYAIFMLDLEGIVTSWNVGAERVKGYLASEILGKHFSCFYSEEDQRSHKPQQELEIAAREGRFEDEGWRIRKDGTRFWATVILTALKDEAGRPCGYSRITRDNTERMLANEALRKAKIELEKQVAEKSETERKLCDSEHALRNLSVHLFRSQDEERKCIGRDLHDGVGQCLAVLKMELDSLKTEFGSSQIKAKRQLEECLQLAEVAIKEIRTLSYTLHPPMLEEMGLKLVIPWYLEDFKQRSGILATFEIEPDLGRLPDDVELAFFRVLQESLSNIHRHSGSQTAVVRLQIKDGLASLEISDLGKGTPPIALGESQQNTLQTQGVGIRGMSERMRQLGGDIQFTSTRQGTTVVARVPCEKSYISAATMA
jgi:PAS domain S-box-containing protein